MTKRTRPIKMLVSETDPVSDEMPPRATPISLKDLRRVRKDSWLAEPETLNVDDFEPDPAFGRLFDALLEDRVASVETRIPLAAIRAGFARASGEWVTEPLREQVVDASVRELRAGHRPAIFLYEVEHAGAPVFACPDDAAVLAAYTKFGATTVPSIIMGPFSQHQHAELRLRVATSSETLSLIHVSTAPALQLKVELGYAPPGTQAVAAIEAADGRLRQSLARLRRIHLESEHIHHNHMLASVLVRGIRAIAAVKCLLYENLTEAMNVVARSLYELAVSYYLDWIAPQRFGPLLAFASAVRPGAHERQYIEAIEGRRRADGWSVADIDTDTSGLRHALHLARNVAARAALTPISRLHDRLYHPLSRIAHQDAGAAALFTNRLGTEYDPLENEQDATIRDAILALETLNYSAALIGFCAEGDIGSDPVAT